MELTSFHTIEDFYNRAAPFLLEREGEHNLILGICAVLMRNPERIEQQPYLATVEHQERVVAAALMTPPNSLIVSYAKAEEAIPLIASDVYTKFDILRGVVSSTPFSEQFAGEWQRLSGRPYKLAMAERIYQLEQVTSVTGVPGYIRKAADNDRELLFRWLADFNKEALGETATSRLDLLVDRFLHFETQGIYIWENEQPVSMAAHNRPTPHGICVQAVYTPPPLRGQGYASACVAALSKLLLDEGRKYCFLYTDLANSTSNHIYQAIGYEPICDAAVYRFGDPILQN
jgi:predicted GNAT family acetyltransferase